MFPELLFVQRERTEGRRVPACDGVEDRYRERL
jgi:hypothetical protein